MNTAAIKKKNTKRYIVENLRNGVQGDCTTPKFALSLGLCTINPEA